MNFEKGAESDKSFSSKNEGFFERAIGGFIEFVTFPIQLFYSLEDNLFS
jgi:hypothetical protein